jgi:predicted MFS family arabinose efflux permease
MTAAAAANAGAPSPGPWAPLKTRAFLVLWLAVLVSNTGTWVRDVASGWLMTELAPSPLLVSMVQAGTTLPIFLLSLPAGALADIVDRRRLLIGVQIGLLLVAGALAATAHAGVMSPVLLLGLVLAGGVGAALAGPAFQAITPELVERPLLRPAVALNSLGVNIARAIGPALGGLVVATAGAAAAYALDAASYLVVIAALLWWRRRPVSADLPPESFGAAVRTGLRYAMGSAALRPVLLRAAAFFLFASAYWALLPLIAREELDGDAGYYGILLAAIGAGAVLGALLLPRLKLAPGALVLGGTLATAAVMAALALAPSRWLAPVLLAGAGAAWIAVLTSLNVAAQAALPNWVRARGLAVYLMVFYGAMTAGSALWGATAQALGVPNALLAAAAAAALASLLVARLTPLPPGEADLTPSLHWPEPATLGPLPGERGPVLITVEYRVAAADRRAFLEALHTFAKARRRDGAFGWRVLEDAEDPERFEEVFWAASWLDHLRQHRRVTRADAELQSRVQAFHLGEAPPRVRHLLAAAPDDVGAPAKHEHPPHDD